MPRPGTGTRKAPGVTGDRGYFVGQRDARRSRSSIPTGISLPHRGVTRNDGTDTNGYSRLTDGDPATYWKSNPYLTRPFTGEDDALHPQWVTIDLAGPQPINAIRIAWAEPFARRYLVQYWTGDGSNQAADDGDMGDLPGRHGDRRERRHRDAARSIRRPCPSSSCASG